MAVGLREDIRLRASGDLTSHLRPGAKDGILRLEVALRCSDGAWRNALVSSKYSGNT